MATIVLSNASVIVNSVDLSDHVKQVTLNILTDLLDDTVMGATFKSKKAGLGDWNVDIDFLQDEASGKVDATLFSLAGIGVSPFPILIKAVNAANSSTNPQYSGNVLMKSYPAITGQVGQLAMSKVSFEGVGTLSRLTS